MKKIKAFSLMEIMIVVVVMGILASIALPNYQKVARTTKCRDAKLQLTALHGANKIYKAESGDFAPVPSSGDLLIGINSTLGLSLMFPNFTFTYSRPSASTYTVTVNYTTTKICDFTLTEIDISDTGTKNPLCKADGVPDGGNCPL